MWRRTDHRDIANISQPAIHELFAGPRGLDVDQDTIGGCPWLDLKGKMSH